MKKIVYLILSLFFADVAKSQCPVALNYDTSFCASNFSITIDASVLDTSLCSDSVTIVLNAANTPLAGDTNVYMLSAPQFTPFVPWGTNPYTTGSTTQNNGIGRMTSLGNNMWAITIHPQSYYNYPADTCLNGIWMVFHNYNASVYLNSDDVSRNFFVLTKTTGQAASTIDPDTVSAYKTVGNVTYKWSDNNTSNPRTFTSGGNYTVTATSVGGCTASGSVTIKAGSHAPVSLGSNLVRCTPNSPITLNAGTGFVRYLWLNDTAYNGSTYTAVKPGPYWIVTTDSSGCTSSASVEIENTEVTNLSIRDSINSCPGTQITVNASTNVNLHGDSIVIIYNATAGTTQLIGVDTVYFHSGPQFTPSQGWQGAYTVGDWGVNNGVGEMTKIGTNLWKITIDPYSYYRINPDTVLTGLWMVFRNSDGTLKGDNDDNENIFVQITPTGLPVSEFEGVTATRTPRLPLTYAWSNSTSGPVITVNTANTYTVTLSDNNGCSASQSVDITFNGLPPISLGDDTTICIGASVTLDAPTGFAHYDWSNNDTTQSILASVAGDYSVTATDTLGCTATGSIQVSTDTNSANFPVVTITPSDSVVCGNIVTLYADTGYASYTWNTGASTSYLYVKDSGTYTLTVTNTFGCSKSQSITIDTSTNFAIVTITPSDSVVCGDTVTLYADTGYASYSWNTGASTSDLFIKDAGTYTLTVTNTSGCSAKKSITIDTCSVSAPVVGCGSPKAAFSVVSVAPYNTVTFQDDSKITKVKSYVWNFGDGTVDSTDTGSTVHTYAVGGDYTVILTIRDSCGGVSSDTVNVLVTTTGISTIVGLNSLNIYPNPSNGRFNIEVNLTTQKQVSFQLFNPVGQLLWQQNTEVASGTTLLNVDAGNLPPGIYLLELNSDSGKAIRKITITK